MVKCFQIKANDNTAVLLDDAFAGDAVEVVGNGQANTLRLNEAIKYGHKIALLDISQNEAVIKYGIRIGHATQNIKAGDWIHLHNCASDYDTRSATLEVESGAPTDTVYE